MAAAGGGVKWKKLLQVAAVVAHAKGINAVDVSPNDQMAATASQDKTVKVSGIGCAWV